MVPVVAEGERSYATSQEPRVEWLGTVKTCVYRWTRRTFEQEKNEGPGRGNGLKGGGEKQGVETKGRRNREVEEKPDLSLFLSR